ncbi:MAG: DUF6691 family protein [Myxococcota bacterium]
MKRLILPFLAGGLFAGGLVISGMTLPAKVVGFLDFFGNWDPSLAFVMGGAIAAYLPLFRLSQKRKPLFSARYFIPTAKDIDAKLLGGAVLFGVGWGLSGFCPGPALTSIGTGTVTVLLFVGSMLAGMGIHHLVTRPKETGAVADAGEGHTDG